MKKARLGWYRYVMRRDEMRECQLETFWSEEIRRCGVVEFAGKVRAGIVWTCHEKR